MKNMIKSIFYLAFTLYALNVVAHDPDLSSTVLIEQSDHSWVLQMRASLTAFEYVVESEYGANSYSTPEEFEHLVIQNVMDQVRINVGQKNEIYFEHAVVKLGHETTVVMKVKGLPADFKSLTVKNSTFKNILRNQNALIILKNGYAKDQFVLNNDNHHTVRLIAEGSKFMVTKDGKINDIFGFNYTIITGLVFLLLGGLVIKVLKNRSMEP